MSACTTDVVVLGGGPAGLATAIELARAGRSVVVLERARPAGPRTGEHLSGEGVRELQRLDPQIELRQIGHASPGTQSAWGDPTLTVRADLFEPWGPSYIVDRELLDAALATSARAWGVRFRDECVRGVVQTPSGLGLSLEHGTLHARFAIDATGRSAYLARALGARILRSDRLVGVAAELSSDLHACDRSVLVESACAGWWYSVPSSERTRVAIYFTDADQVRSMQTLQAWRSALEASVHTRQRLAGMRLMGKLCVRAAGSQRLDHAAGARFVAVGDAAMAWDPLSSSGLTHALCDGAQAAHAIDRALAHDSSVLTAYAARKRREFARYLVTRAHYYRAETRFASAPFWQTRQRPALLEQTIRVHPQDSLEPSVRGSDTLLTAGLSSHRVLAAVGQRACARDIVQTLLERTQHAYLPDELVAAVQTLLDQRVLVRSAELTRASPAGARSDSPPDRESART